MDQLLNNNSAVITECLSINYLEVAPFHPHKIYPEYYFSIEDVSDQINPAYDGLRNSFYLLEMDIKNYNTLNWNPLCNVVKPGDNVVVKPNYVQHVNYSEQDYNSVVVHTSLIRAIIDYILIALKGNGKITIADAPLWDADFDVIIKRMQVNELLMFYKENNIEIDLIDMRRMRVTQKHGLVVDRRFNEEMIKNSKVIDLSNKSEFCGFEKYENFLNGMDYNRSKTVKHHSNGKHEYCVSKVILDADVIINMPKLKTHKKSGITLSMKNLVGINVDKNFLPHYRIGMPLEGGDEYPDLDTLTKKICSKILRWCIDVFLMRAEKFMVPILTPFFSIYGFILRRLQKKRPESILGNTHPGYNQMLINSIYKVIFGSDIRAGNWEGNDTIWRMIIDLNKILIYADKKGFIKHTPQRRHFSIVDGIVGGEKDGPMNPDPVYSNVLVCGFNPFHVDIAAAKVMGFNIDKIKVLSEVNRIKVLPLTHIFNTTIISNNTLWNNNILYKNSLKFIPHKAWSIIQGS
jgi:uncharacterized protein (DUF362 family)